jgi:Uma2 family endonuclease
VQVNGLNDMIEIEERSRSETMNEVNRLSGTARVRHRKQLTMEVEAPPSQRGEPAWEVACIFPVQGDWSVEEYLSLPTNHLVEFEDGRLEVLPMPLDFHQAVVLYLLEMLLAFAKPRRKGVVRTAPLPVRLWEDKFREPDILFMLARHKSRIRGFWDGADLVMEVVSDDAKGRKRDLVKKRLEYAKARIPEYWIIDPKDHKIIVLTLKGKTYRVHGEFTKGMQATSVLLPGFSVSVDEVFAQGD